MLAVSSEVSVALFLAPNHCALDHRSVFSKPICSYCCAELTLSRVLCRCSEFRGDQGEDADISSADEKLDSITLPTPTSALQP